MCSLRRISCVTSYGRGACRLPCRGGWRTSSPWARSFNPRFLGLKSDTVTLSQSAVIGIVVLTHLHLRVHHRQRHPPLQVSRLEHRVSVFPFSRKFKAFPDSCLLLPLLVSLSKFIVSVVLYLALWLPVWLPRLLPTGVATGQSLGP